MLANIHPGYASTPLNAYIYVLVLPPKSLERRPVSSASFASVEMRYEQLSSFTLGNVYSLCVVRMRRKSGLLPVDEWISDA